jgi:hypothetical protein
MRGPTFRFAQAGQKRGRQRSKPVTVHAADTRTAFTAAEDRPPPPRISIAHPPGARARQNFLQPEMAWRPSANLMDGELDNRAAGSVNGWLRFHRRGKPPLRVLLHLAGDFHGDIRGKVIRLSNPRPTDRNEQLGRSGSYMDGFLPVQEGQAGDITAGVPIGLKDDGEASYAYAPYPYVEWYGPNGRIVLELDASQVEIVDGAKVLKVPRSAREYHTEAEAIEQLASLFDGSVTFSVDRPEGS